METIAIHPPFTHFAIAFPLMLLIIHLFYMINKKRVRQSAQGKLGGSIVYENMITPWLK